MKRQPIPCCWQWSRSPASAGSLRVLLASESPSHLYSSPASAFAGLISACFCIGCRLAGYNGNSQGAINEESKYHPDTLVCGPPKLPWPILLKKYQSFG